jgi:hypothetical protein
MTCYDFQEDTLSKNSLCMVSLMRGRASEDTDVNSSDTLCRSESLSWERMGERLTASG